MTIDIFRERVMRATAAMRNVPYDPKDNSLLFGISYEEVSSMTGLKRSTIYSYKSKGLFGEDARTKRLKEFEFGQIAHAMKLIGRVC